MTSTRLLVPDTLTKEAPGIEVLGPDLAKIKERYEPQIEELLAGYEGKLKPLQDAR